MILEINFFPYCNKILQLAKFIFILQYTKLYIAKKYVATVASLDSISEFLGDRTSRSPLALASHGYTMEYSFGKYTLNLAIRYLSKAVLLRNNLRILQLYRYMYFMKKSNNSFLAPR